MESKDTVMLVTNEGDVSTSGPDESVKEASASASTATPLSVNPTSTPEVITSQPTYSQSSWASQSKWSNQSAPSMFALGDIGARPLPHPHLVDAERGTSTRYPSVSGVTTSGQMHYQGGMQNQEIPNNYLIWSVFTTLFCCLLLGGFAAKYSNETTLHIRRGNLVKARETSKQAKELNIMAMVLGPVVIVGLVLLNIYVLIPNNIAI